MESSNEIFHHVGPLVLFPTLPLFKTPPVKKVKFEIAKNKSLGKAFEKERTITRTQAPGFPMKDSRIYLWKFKTEISLKQYSNESLIFTSFKPNPLALIS